MRGLPGDAPSPSLAVRLGSFSAVVPAHQYYSTVFSLRRDIGGRGKTEAERQPVGLLSEMSRQVKKEYRRHLLCSTAPAAQ